MDKSQNFQPFTLLGSQLKSLREAKSESLDEVSGAIEIDNQTLEKFETGAECPSQDILILMINHFAVHDDKAVKLWRLAGYDPQPRAASDHPENHLQQTMITVMMALDPRIIYSDSARIAADKNGIVFDFMQTSAKGQIVPISRVGMSYAQAKDFLEVLNNTLNQATNIGQPKKLPPTNPSPKNKRQNS
ncbi:MAG: helix-turn-helix domain-containing protein [Candidatus Saccharimonadales bacterium]